MSARLRPLDEGLWICDAAQKFMGLPFGTRMTLVRLADQSLVVHSPVALDDALRAEVDALGAVQVVIAPNCFHHLYASQWLDTYGDAKCWAAPGLRKKRPDLRIDHDLRAETPSWSVELEILPIPKTPAWEETILWHAASRSVIAADLIQNYPKALPGVWAWVYQKLAGLYERPGLSRAIRLGFRDKPGARALIDELIARDPKRIVIAHGEIIETDAAETLRNAYAWL